MKKIRPKPVRTPKQILAKRLRYKENVKIRKARLLQVIAGGIPGTYIVSSGSVLNRVHVVTQGSDGIFGENNDCDCSNGRFNCSHVLASRLFCKRTIQEISEQFTADDRVRFGKLKE